MTDASACDCKVGRTAADFDLSDLDDDLLARHREGASLRDLAGHVNRGVLRAALDRAEGDLLEGGDRLFGALDADEVVGAVYEALAGEEVDAERRARVRTRLEQAGVDVDAVEDSWVTHPTVRAHLRECLGADTSSSASLSVEGGLDTVEWAVTRCRGVVEGTVRRLRSAGRLSVADPEVDVAVRITCLECGETYAPSELFSAGGCACADER